MNSSHELPLQSLINNDHHDVDFAEITFQDVAVADAVVTTESNGHEESFLKRHKAKIAAGSLMVGAGIALLTNSTSELAHDVKDAAPWTAAGIGTTEVMWDAGAAMMLLSAGKSVGNPLKIKGRWGEITDSVSTSSLAKTGLAINTAGAIGMAGVIAAGASQLPVETWPGAAGLIGLDVASTVALRAPIVAKMRSVRVNHTVEQKETTRQPKVTVRKAQINDMERLADIDLLLFDKAYGSDKPDKAEVVDMLTRRYLNNPDWMFVSEMNGQVEGFVSAFRTSKPYEDFVSWEESTADGTLDGKVDPNGEFVYVTNMTIKHEAVEAGAEDMLLAQLFANAIEKGVKYGYFVSRMPYFKRWAEANGVNIGDKNALNGVAESYFNSRDESGKRIDKQLRMYEGYGFKLKKLVGGGFDDEASLGYGVVCVAECPPYKDVFRHKPILWLMSRGLRQAAKHPKILSKVL